jgi:hypothetical protein
MLFWHFGAHLHDFITVDFYCEDVGIIFFENICVHLPGNTTSSWVPTLKKEAVSLFETFF